MSGKFRLGPAPFGPLAHAVLRLPLAHRLLDHSMCEIRFIAPESGQQVKLLVRYARSGNEIIVLVREAGRAGWWQAFARTHPAQILLGRRWYQGLGRLARFGQRQWSTAQCGYQERFPSIGVTEADAFVVVALRPTGAYELVPDALTALHVAPA